MKDINFNTLRDLKNFLNTLSDEELDSTSAGCTYSDDVDTDTVDLTISNGEFEFVGSTNNV